MVDCREGAVYASGGSALSVWAPIVSFFLPATKEDRKFKAPEKTDFQLLGHEESGRKVVESSQHKGGREQRPLLVGFKCKRPPHRVYFIWHDEDTIRSLSDMLDVLLEPAPPDLPILGWSDQPRILAATYPYSPSKWECWEGGPQLEDKALQELNARLQARLRRWIARISQENRWSAMEEEIKTFLDECSQNTKFTPGRAPRSNKNKRKNAQSLAASGYPSRR